MQSFPISPASVLFSAARHRELISQLIWREVAGRYRGSFLGLLWSFLNPLLSLLMYTFVFGIVLKARWAPTDGSTLDFALVLFAGLVVHGLLAECISRAPYLILGNSSYVKQVVFPLEILPLVALGSALFHASISILLLIGAWAIANGEIHLSVLFIPFLLFPLCLIGLGLGWLLSATAVYFRDVGQLVSFVTAGLLFFSPVFYPASAVPRPFSLLLQFNPLTFVIEEMRSSLVAGTLPSGVSYGVYLSVSLVVAWLGYIWFQKVRHGFGDVI